MKYMELPDLSGYCLECGAEREPSSKCKGLFKSKCPSCGDETWVEKEVEETFTRKDLSRFFCNWLVGSLFMLAILHILPSLKWGDDWEIVWSTQTIFPIVLVGLLYAFSVEAKSKE